MKKSSTYLTWMVTHWWEPRMSLGFWHSKPRHNEVVWMCCRDSRIAWRTGGRERQNFSGEGMKFEPGLYLPLKKIGKIKGELREENLRDMKVIINCNFQERSKLENLPFKFLFLKVFSNSRMVFSIRGNSFCFFDDMFFFLWWSSWGFLNIFKNYIPEN